MAKMAATGAQMKLAIRFWCVQHVGQQACLWSLTHRRPRHHGRWVSARHLRAPAGGRGADRASGRLQRRRCLRTPRLVRSEAKAVVLF